MPVANLYHVTETLIRLLERNVPQVISSGTVNVGSRPPEALTGSSRALNVFLYHATEDPNYRNQEPRGTGLRGVATTPMALILYYIVTAHHESQSVYDASVEQELFGAALKTLHDYPFIDRETTAPEGPTASAVMNPATIGATNSALEIVLRPVTPEEALSFWSSEQHQTARLSAYYEVRTVFLEAEEPTRFPGVVQRVGSYVFPISAPILSGSWSRVLVAPPAAIGMPASRLRASPARPFAVTASEAATDDSPAEFRLSGSNLVAGRRRRLTLRHPHFARLTPPMRQIPVDPLLNDANGWRIAFSETEIAAAFGEALTFEREDGTQETITLYPGTYMVAVEAEIGAYEAGSRRRPILERSNEVAVLRGPYVSGVSDVNAAGDFDVSISPAFDLDRDNGDELRELDITLVIGSVAYRRVLDSTELDAEGQFFAEPARVTARAAFDPSVAAVHPVRLIVEGVDAQPYWMEVQP